MNKFIDKEYAVLSKPLTRAEAIRGMDDAGYIEGVISISLSSLIDSDYEGFLDLISEKLIGYICLSGINYKIVGCGNDNEVLLLVSGHAEELGDIPDNIVIELPEKFTFSSAQNSLASGIIYHAERSNEHGDFHVSWGWDADESHGIETFEAKGEDYTVQEVKHFVNSGQWVIRESV